MYRTITLGSCISVQGRVLRELPDGRVRIRVGEKTFEGFPVDHKPEPEEPSLSVKA